MQSCFRPGMDPSSFCFCSDCAGEDDVIDGNWQIRDLSEVITYVGDTLYETSIAHEKSMV